jgi:amidophosphoribosyltransferase
MVRATEKNANRFCLACFNGDYPIPVDPKVDKFIMERRRNRATQLIEPVPQQELFPLQ